MELPTSTPRKDEGPCANNSDPLHNRGKVKVVDSFAEVSDHLKQGKGGKKKSSQGAEAKQSQPSTSAHTAPVTTGTGRP